jgi:hypothetical protein
MESITYAAATLTRDTPRRVNRSNSSARSFTLRVSRSNFANDDGIHRAGIHQ